MHSYCQSLEDIFALNFVKNVLGKKNGFYIDIGANDGVTGSNSKLLEEHGWQGVLVEPNPNLQAELKANRPLALIKQYAITDQTQIEFNCVQGEGNLHGLSRIDDSQEFADHVEKHGGKIQKHIVMGKKLTDLLIEIDAPKDLDFLSIDVEGHELSVLKTLDFDRFQPKLICLEDNSKGECLENCNYLKDKGYVYICRTGVNDWYTLARYAGHFRFDRLHALFTKFRWRLKTKFYESFGLKKAKPHV